MPKRTLNLGRYSITTLILFLLLANRNIANCHFTQTRLGLAWFALPTHSCGSVSMCECMCESAVINPIDLEQKRASTTITMTTDYFVCAGFNKRASDYEWIAHHVHVHAPLSTALSLPHYLATLFFPRCPHAPPPPSPPPPSLFPSFLPSVSLLSSPLFPCFIWLFHPPIPTHSGHSLARLVTLCLCLGLFSDSVSPLSPMDSKK